MMLDHLMQIICLLFLMDTYYVQSGLIGISKKEIEVKLRESIMSRQSPSRYQRSKGIKIKHVLQICFFLAICFWMIYQVKHSHDKKKEYEESDEKMLLHRGSSDNIIKLGRKDIRSQMEDTVSKNEKRDDELEEEEEEDKNDEDEQGEKKIRGNENEGVEAEKEEEEEEEEESDENEREKLDSEIDREEDFVDDEEREDSDDKESEERDTGDSKKDILMVDVDHGGDDRRTHEAREEHYKADDASSAVTHDTQIDEENSNKHLNIVLGREKEDGKSEETNTPEIREELGVENSKTAKGSNESDITTKETLFGNSQNDSFSNNTLAEGSSYHLQVKKNSREKRMENLDSFSTNVTGSVSDNSISGSISMISAEINVTDSNSEFSRTSNHTDSSGLDKISTSKASMDTNGGKNEILDSKMPENDDVQHDPIDLSDSLDPLEDKDVPKDLGTLHHGIQDKVTHTEDAAAGRTID